MTTPSLLPTLKMVLDYVPDVARFTRDLGVETSKLWIEILKGKDDSDQLACIKEWHRRIDSVTMRNMQQRPKELYVELEPYDIQMAKLPLLGDWQYFHQIICHCGQIGFWIRSDTSPNVAKNYSGSMKILDGIPGWDAAEEFVLQIPRSPDNDLGKLLSLIDREYCDLYRETVRTTKSLFARTNSL